MDFIHSKFRQTFEVDGLFPETCVVETFTTGTYSTLGEYAPTWTTHLASTACRAVPVPIYGTDERRSEEDTVNKFALRVCINTSTTTITPHMRLQFRGTVWNIITSEYDGNAKLVYLDVERVSQ